MATIATPNWESGRIIYPESLWGTLIKELSDFKEAKLFYVDKTLSRVETDRFKVLLTTDVIYWGQTYGEVNDSDPLKLFMIASMEKTKWTTYTGGVVYGGLQDSNHIKHIFGPLGKEHARKYKLASKKSIAEGGIRESDVIETVKQDPVGNKKRAVRGPSVSAAPNRTSPGVEPPVRASKRPKAVC